MRKVKLTDEQRERLWTSRRKTDMVGKALSAALWQLSEEMVYEETKFWNCVRELADIDENIHCKVDWVNSEIVIKENEE